MVPVVAVCPLLVLVVVCRITFAGSTVAFWFRVPMLVFVAVVVAVVDGVVVVFVVVVFLVLVVLMLLWPVAVNCLCSVVAA